MKPIEAHASAPAGASGAEDEPSPRDVLEEVALATPVRPSPAPLPVVRSARLVDLAGVDAVITWRGSDERVRALVASEVEPELLLEALKSRTSVLVECDGDGTPIVIGLVQTSRPRDLVLSGERVEIRADREVLLRTGRAGLRLRDDGEVELVGARISAVSRGLFRIVGRMLKLN
jgi:hypothetical protein